MMVYPGDNSSFKYQSWNRLPYFDPVSYKIKKVFNKNNFEGFFPYQLFKVDIR